MRVRFRDVNTVREFVEAVQHLPFDINVSDNHRLLDGKSFLSLVNLDLNKVVTVTPVTNDFDRIDQFYGAVWKFREATKNE